MDEIKLYCVKLPASSKAHEKKYRRMLEDLQIEEITGKIKDGYVTFNYDGIDICMGYPDSIKNGTYTYIYHNSMIYASDSLENLKKVIYRTIKSRIININQRLNRERNSYEQSRNTIKRYKRKLERLIETATYLNRECVLGDIKR